MVPILIGVATLAGTGYFSTHPTAPPKTESFRVGAYLPNEVSSVAPVGNCTWTPYTPTKEYYVPGPLTINVVVRNTGDIPVYLDSIDVNSNVSAVPSQILDVPSEQASVPTGTIQNILLTTNTANWPTNTVVKFYFTVADVDGITNGTSLVLEPLFHFGNSGSSIATSTITTTTTQATSSLSTTTCHIVYQLP